MIRRLCPVCRRAHPINKLGRLEPHRRKLESALLRDLGVRNGTPCEGTGRLPLKTAAQDSTTRTRPQGGTSRRKEDATQ